jgi:hypothetical protein
VIKRPLAVLLALAFTLSVRADVQVVPPGNQITGGSGGGGGGASTSANNDWTGTNNFTTPLEVYATTTHTGNNRVSITHSGTQTIITSQAGALNLFAGSDYIRVGSKAGGAVEGYINDQGLLGFGGDLTGRPQMGYYSGPSATTGTLWMGLATGDRTLHIGESGDKTTNVGNGACGTTTGCTNPQIALFGATPTATNYLNVGMYGTAGGTRKTLTGGAATSVIRIPVAASAGTGGLFSYCVFAADATDQQSRCGSIRFAVVNKGGTETCTLGAASEAADGSVLAASSATTLTYAITCDTTPANAVDIQFNAVSGLTETTLELRGTVNLVGPGEPLPQ